VFHRGALGDSVLLWPALRAARGRGDAVTLVTDGSKARLAQAELGITGLDAEQPRFNALWREGARIEPIEGVSEVLAYDASPAGHSATWFANAARMFPGASLRHMPCRPDRRNVAELVAEFGHDVPIPERRNAAGPVVIHIGAGSLLKRWPLAQFATLASDLRDAGCTVRLIAGEAEGIQPTTQTPLGGGGLDGCLAPDSLATLDALAEAIRPARLFIGCDTGPTHIAAQLGVATLALFGPTCPHTWAPVGSRVRILAPPQPSPMDWLTTDHILAAARSLLS
jgi:hypothetical protein